ncbi:hypothetical protein E0L36_03145 [Streptomyces sp. AJS327]|uniref:hypothetical protein n=1 Tax=Streptomyces sp. AJS327 TaxID=2545265 RepID=UPI0015DFC42C|nr:hypothetical protein [Streptomyces sp. AJS327]MBA0049928.1 hypothetical protein [Streptomyces sp. AJS327]
MPAPLLLFLSPLLLLLSPFLGLYALARSARLASYRIFGPGVPIRAHDRAVARVKRFRVWSAALVSFGVLMVFGTAEDVMEQAAERWLVFFVAPWLLIVSAPVVVGVLIACSYPARRRAMRSALRTPLGKLLRFLGVLALVPACFLLLSEATPSHSQGVEVLWVMACFAATAWSLFLFVFASISVVRSGFGAAAVHPALPALLASVLVWEYAAIGGLPAGPPAIAYVVLVGGPASVTAIAWWEIHRLRTRYGVTLRGG